jgi:hypothetical protein
MRARFVYQVIVPVTPLFRIRMYRAGCHLSNKPLRKRVVVSQDWERLTFVFTIAL